mmetsp:Transcript_29617/g.114180  ORF Transcript_29617/g.114180 Transcript_29617/m.114180 type:complete len:90 (-) Transcript_29617:163-432(-)
MGFLKAKDVESDHRYSLFQDYSFEKSPSGSSRDTNSADLFRKDTYIAFSTEAATARRVREQQTFHKRVRRGMSSRMRNLFRRDDTWIRY